MKCAIKTILLLYHTFKLLQYICLKNRFKETSHLKLHKPRPLEFLSIIRMQTNPWVFSQRLLAPRLADTVTATWVWEQSCVLKHRRCTWRKSFTRMKTARSCSQRFGRRRMSFFWLLSWETLCCWRTDSWRRRETRFTTNTRRSWRSATPQTPPFLFYRTRGIDFSMLVHV